MSTSRKRTLLEISQARSIDSSNPVPPNDIDPTYDLNVSVKNSPPKEGEGESQARRKSQPLPALSPGSEVTGAITLDKVDVQLNRSNAAEQVRRKRQSVEKSSDVSSQECLSSELTIPPPCASPISSMPGATNRRTSKSDEETELVEFIKANVDVDSVPRSTRDRESPTAESEGRRSPSSLTGSNASTKGKKRRPTTWFNNMISPNYKTRSDELRKLFKDIPQDERLLVDYSCALQKNILFHGRLYVTQDSICFYSNIFTMETTLTIKCKDITAMTKERTARVIPNAIQITTSTDKFFFSSFGSRDKTYLTLFRVWQNSQLEQPLSSHQLWSWIHAAYGDELGLTASDDDYIAPSPDEESNSLQFDNFDRSVTRKEENEKADGSFLCNGELHVDGISMETTSTEDLNNSPKVFASPRPVLTLDGAESPKEKDIATDSGDTTEDSDGEVECAAHDHKGANTLDKVFNIQIDTLFEMLFSDSDFMKSFYKDRKTTDVVMSPWQVEEDDQSIKYRTISYTLSLNASFGPKTTPATEKQLCSKESHEGRCYYVECRCLNDPGLPYGENFYCINNFCLTRVTAKCTRLKVHSEIVYVKSVWGLVKSIIEKNVNSGLTQYYNALRVALQHVSDNQVASASSALAVKKKVVRRRRRQSSVDRTLTTISKTVPVVPPAEVTLKPDTSLLNYGISGETVVRVMCVVLVCLVLMNGLLFYKMSSLESVAPFSKQHLDKLRQSPRSQEDWMTILHTQSSLHEQELIKWKNILNTSIQLLDKMKQNLKDLQEGVQKRQDLLQT